MHRLFILGLIAIVYYGLAFYGLLFSEAEILLSSIVLFGVPAYALSHFSNAPTNLLVVITSLGVGIAVLLEGIAHIYGLWYSIGLESVRLFGLVPVEAIVATTLQVLFLVLLYEVLFDDGVYTEMSIRKRLMPSIVFASGTLGVFLLLNVLRDTYFINYTYIWMIIGLLGVTSISLFTQRAFSVQFLDRLVYFVTVASIPMVLSLVLSVTNTHKIFAHIGEYAYVFTFLGETVPLEEVLLVLSIPFFVATVYELYLDDQS